MAESRSRQPAVPEVGASDYFQTSHVLFGPLEEKMPARLGCPCQNNEQAFHWVPLPLRIITGHGTIRFENCEPAVRFPTADPMMGPGDSERPRRKGSHVHLTPLPQTSGATKTVLIRCHQPGRRICSSLRNSILFGCRQGPDHLLCGPRFSLVPCNHGVLSRSGLRSYVVVINITIN